MASKQMVRPAVAEIDLDALLAERQIEQPRSVKLFGESHVIVRPATPAGLLQMLELQKAVVRRRLEAQDQPDEVASLMRVAEQITQRVEVLLLVAPSLAKHREALRQLDFQTLEAIAEKIELERLMEEAMGQLGLRPAEGASEGAAEGAGGSGSDLEGN